MSIKFLAVDGFNLIRRIYEARNVSTMADMPGVFVAVKSSLQRALTAHHPSHAALVLEHHDKTWRHLLYPAYKANRGPTPPLLLDGLDQFSEAAAELGITTISIPSYEADDVIATITQVVATHAGEVVVLSTDKIFLQLISDHVTVFDHFGETDFDGGYVEKHYDVKVAQYVDYLALVGDPSNNIKGVSGIGKKGAAELLRHFESLDEIIAATEPDQKTEKVKSQAILAKRCKQLVTLKTDVELGQNLKTFRLSGEQM